MRITLDIDKDILETAKAIDRKERKSAGVVISYLARRALTQPTQQTGQPVHVTESFSGFHPLPAGSRVITEETIERLREQEGI